MCFYLDSCNLRNPIPAVSFHSVAYQVLEHAVATQSLLDFGVPVEKTSVWQGSGGEDPEENGPGEGSVG